MASDLYVIYACTKNHITGFPIVWPYKIRVSVYQWCECVEKVVSNRQNGWEMLYAVHTMISMRDHN